MRAAISPATAAILIEGIQGEGGVTPATPEYLLGLRQLCDEKKLLLLMDGVQDAAISAPAGFRASSGSWKDARRRGFCRTAFRWPNRSAADFRSARFGCGRRMRICWAQARTAPRMAARRWDARWR